MIKEVCDKLKARRKELGYSIEYTVEKTKLHPSMIKDIENCNLENIGSTYLKGFMKIYASFLGVDLGSCLEELPSVETSPTPERKIKRKESSPVLLQTLDLMKKISPEVRKKIIMVLVAIALLWGLFIVGGSVIRKISKAIRKEKVKVQDTQPQSFSGVTQGEQLAVSLTAKKRCFLKVIVDGTVLFEAPLNEGAIETWKGNNEIEFKISDGSAVYIEVNGKPIPTLTSIRKPIKSLKITPSGITVDK